MWNGRVPDRAPELILLPRTAGEVAAAIRIARGRGLAVAVRGGGHSWRGAPLRDGGALIDVSGLRGLRIDPRTRTARAGPGMTGGELVARLAPYGLAFPAGHCGEVALSGYLLAGGFGWNAGVWGPACDRVRAVEAVMPDGRAVRADRRRSPDLLWAARGGGPLFPGVVTAFELDLAAAPGHVARTAHAYGGADAAAVVEHLDAIAPRLAPEVEVTVAIGARAERIGLTGTAFAAGPDAARRALGPLEEGPAARARERRAAEPSSLAGLHAAMADVFPRGPRYAADVAWAEPPLAAALLDAAGVVARAPSDRSFVMATLAPATPHRVGETWGALSLAGAAFVACYAVWEDPADDAANEAWLRDAVAAVRPAARGRYVGEADLLAAPAADCYSPGAWDRLASVRERAGAPGALQPALAPPSRSP